mmetsp:Transcript_68123/g.134450  ORF Transcript_68123/g.134450 Transcript_68123/m.134450 type:complete len:584 (+) Transcript_68123:37-1788(+)
MAGYLKEPLPPDKAAESPMLSWLEAALRAERHAVDLALAMQHMALLQELAPQLAEMHRRSCSAETAPARAVDNLSSRLTNHQQLRHGQQKPPTPGTPSSPSSSFLEEDEVIEQTPPGKLPLGNIWMDTDAESPSSPERPQRDSGESRMSGRTSENTDSTNGTSAKEKLKSPKNAGLQLKRKTMKNTGQTGPLALLDRWVGSTTFETAFAALILLNTLVMAVESQYRGLDSGFKVGYPGSNAPADDVWPWARLFFDIMEWFFGILFTIELFMKIITLRRNFCCDVWNIVDFVIVAAWLFTAFGTVQFPIDPMLLRLARLARLLRLLKLVHTIQACDSLYLMTTAMTGSISVLFWSVCLLVIVQMMIAFLLQQLLETYVVDESKPKEQRMEVFKFYGTFARTMLTMFEITLGNWMPPCRALVENVNEWYMIFSLSHKLVIGFSVVSVITGVFIQETFKVATTDDRIMVMIRERASKTHSKKMTALFNSADTDGSGFIDYNEYREIFEDPEVITWLAAMELDVTDLDMIFELLDTDSDGRLSRADLVQGISRLKGHARNCDMISLHRENMQLGKKLGSIEALLSDR